MLCRLHASPFALQCSSHVRPSSSSTLHPLIMCSAEPGGGLQSPLTRSSRPVGGGGNGARAASFGSLAKGDRDEMKSTRFPRTRVFVTPLCIPRGSLSHPPPRPIMPNTSATASQAVSSLKRAAVASKRKSNVSWFSAATISHRHLTTRPPSISCVISVSCSSAVASIIRCSGMPTSEACRWMRSNQFCCDAADVVNAPRIELSPTCFVLGTSG
mmetsp:Transcript_31861/g.64626  ORF Transcript_31861/g.64626 Transcript_31861/m.64626 type:complete len:214 (-) Transcript_31861:84-725(-)